MMGLPLLSSCKGVEIADDQFCSPAPGAIGAACDNFLSSNQQLLNQTQWLALQAQWQNQGYAVECTNSKFVGDLKKEIEDLCSKTKCSYEIQAAVTTLSRMLDVGELSKDML